MLDYVKEELRTTVSGNKIPTVDIITTTQNWSQFTSTWDFQNLDKNIEPPFIATVRQPEVKYGTNPSTQYTIPDRKKFYYAKVPTWDGTRKGMDIYKIPQPIPVDITYNVKIFCNRMRELNEFNRKVLQKFSSRQSYTVVKGHYVPIILDSISDESSLDIEKRKYYIQNYTFIMLGFLIDEDEFEISPAISRSLMLTEIETSTRKNKLKKFPENPDRFNFMLKFESGSHTQSKTFDYGTDLTVLRLNNVEDYSVFINGVFYQQNPTVIPINLGDEMTVTITPSAFHIESDIIIESKLVNSQHNMQVSNNSRSQTTSSDNNISQTLSSGSNTSQTRSSSTSSSSSGDGGNQGGGY